MNAWPTSSIGEIAQPKQWPTLSMAEMAATGFPVYGANGRIGYTDEFTHERPTILIGCRGSCGTVHITEPRSYANGNAMALDGLDESRVDIQFLARFLVHRGFHDVTTGTSQPQIIRQNLIRVLVPLPPLSVQRRIAEILNKADALRAKRRATLAQLDTLTRSIFLDMFGDPATNSKGWPVRRIGDLLESASYGTSEKAEAEGEVPVLRMSNITRTGEIDLTDLKYMNLAEGDRERYLVRKGDVLFNRTNSADLVGKTAIFREHRPMAYAGYLIRLRVNRENDPEYIACFLNTDYSKRVLRGMCKSIIGMANINATEVQAVRVPQPPIRVQQEFADRVVRVEQTKAAYRNSLAELDALFASLQHRAFRGEL